MRPSQTLSVLEDLFVQHRGHLMRKGVRLSPEDSQTTVEVYTQWVLLAIDLGYLSLCSKRAVTVRIISDLMNRDVFEVISTFADCVDFVRYQSKVGFKARLRSASPHIWGQIFDDVEQMSAGNHVAAKRLNQLFSYPTRLSLRDVDLLDESLQAYRETEDNMPTTYDPVLIKQLNKIIKKWMREFSDSDFVFKHGNGSVAGHKLVESTLETKYRDMFVDPMLEYAYKEKVRKPQPKHASVTTAPARVSQTVFVPKSYKALRTISKEPSTLMYYQQGVWREIDRVIRTHPYLRKRIDVHDQTRNQKLAQIGSIGRNYATIDLSAASDSNSWTLVKEGFRGTKVLRHVFATRSTHTVLPDGTFLKLKKFAPMGSALCFPIETIIFAAICEMATQKIGRMRREPAITGDYSVYGDDIIVPTCVAKEVTYLLNAFGFTLNTSKSFSNEKNWFRESCGGEYVDGYDITPMRVSRNYYSSVDDVSLFACRDSANEAYLRGLNNLRSFFIKKMKSKRGFIPLFSPTSILSDNYTNYHTKKKWNRHLQCWTYRATIIEATASTENKNQEGDTTVVESHTGLGDEDIRYEHWLTMTYLRKRVDEAFKSNVGKKTTGTRISYVTGPQVYEIPEAYVRER